MKRCIIPIFIPHYGCPRQCIFCNQHKITGNTEPVKPDHIAATINRYLATVSRDTTFVEVAFYGGSFTALPADTQCSFLQPAYEALNAGKINAIRLSTRPDCIDQDTLARLRQYQVATVELGVQSLDDAVLQTANRGHTARDALRAVEMVRQAGFTCGVQLMPGLPAESWRSLIKTTELAVKCRPDFIRLYPTVVLADTGLADLYQQGEFQPLSLDEAIKRCAYMKLVCERNHIPVIRTGLQASQELEDSAVTVAGPYHPAFGELVDSHIYYLVVAHAFEQIGLLPAAGSMVILHVHPREESKVRGMKNDNLRRWRQEYGAICKLQGDLNRQGSVIIEFNFTKFVGNKLMLFSV